MIYFYPIAGAGAQVRARGSDVRAHETRIKASGLGLWTVKRRAAESNGRILFLPFYIFAFLGGFRSLIIAYGMNADIFCAFVYVCANVWVIIACAPDVM